MASRPPTKRLRNYSREKRETPGEASSSFQDHGSAHVGQLYCERVRLPTTEVSDQQYNARERDIYMKGLKVNMKFFGFHADGSGTLTIPESRTRGYMGPMKVNFALVQMNCKKQSSELVDVNGYNLDAKLVADSMLPEFFSSHEGLQNMSRAFNQLNAGETSITTAVGKWNDYWVDGAMNPDSSVGYKILARETGYFQQIFQNGAGGPGQKNQFYLSKYFKIKSPIKLHDNLETNWIHPIYMLWWVVPLNPQYLQNYAILGINSPANHFKTQIRQTIYYNEIKK